MRPDRGALSSRPNLSLSIHLNAACVARYVVAVLSCASTHKLDAMKASAIMEFD
jgi:hypothetical protein